MSIRKPVPRRTKATHRAQAAGVPRREPGQGLAAGGTLGAASGAAAGAALGAFAGPPGALAGAVLGAVAGAATGVALAGDRHQAQRDQLLDQEIGITGETPLGAAPADAPKATRGTYSAASVGADTASMTDDMPDEGPFPHDG